MLCMLYMQSVMRKTHQHACLALSPAVSALTVQLECEPACTVMIMPLSGTLVLR